MMHNSFDIKYDALKGVSNIIYLNDDAKIITEAEFETELTTGYRAAILLIPVANAIQLQIAMITPYHKDHYQIDPGFVVENYNNYVRDQGGENAVLEVGEDEFYIGEIENI